MANMQVLYIYMMVVADFMFSFCFFLFCFFANMYDVTTLTRLTKKDRSRMPK